MLYDYVGLCIFSSFDLWIQRLYLGVINLDLNTSLLL
jgi:hypothetical protein